MYKRIDHIGIAVKDVNRYIKIFRNKLKMNLDKVEDFQSKGAKFQIAFFPIGESDIEFVQSSEETVLVADFIREKGEGIYHIALEVEDIENLVSQLKGEGIKFVWDISEGSRGTKIAFIDPKDTGGVLIELVQKM